MNKTIFSIKQNFQHTVFYHYYLTYLAVLIVPILLLSFIQYYNSYSIIKENIIQKEVKNLERTSELIDGQIEQLKNMLILMGASTETRAFEFYEEPFSAYKIIQSFQQNTMTNSFISYGGVYFFGENHPYSRSNAEILDTFAELHFSDRESFLELLESREGDLFFTRTDSQLVLMYNFPVGAMRNKAGKVLFFMDDEIIEKFFINRDTYYEIEDREGVLLFSSSMEESTSKNDLIIRHTSGSGLSYISRVPVSVISSDLWRYSSRYILVVILFLVISFPLIFSIASLQITPIRNLNDFIRQLTGVEEDDKDKPIDDFKNIQENIDTYVRKMDPALITQITMDLINGRIHNVNQLNRRSGHLEFKWNAPFHTILLLAYRDNSRISNDEIEKVENELGKGAIQNVQEYLISNHLIENKSVIIIGFDKIPGESELNKLFSPILSRSWVLGYGTSKESLEMLNTAYSEAFRALEYGQFGGKANVIPYQSIKETNENENIVNSSRLEYMLFEKKDVSGIRKELDLIQKLLEEERPTLFQMKRIYYELSNMALMINQKHQYPDTFQIEKINNVDELIKIIHELVNQTLKEQLEEKIVIPEFITGIEQFIEDNISNNLLSLTFLSDKFNLSTAYISRSFKKYRNLNISKYISSLRLDQAKTLLRNSTLSVHEIIQSVGYFDASSFSRLFKKNEGITPLEYRSKMTALSSF
jgi:two-component system response regulator YesN